MDDETTDTLRVDPDWKEILSQHSIPPIPVNSSSRVNTALKCHLIMSLIIHLKLSLRDFLFFLFESPIVSVKTRAGAFVANNSTFAFGPAHLYDLWHTRFPNSRSGLHGMIVGCAEEIILEESDRIINDPDLKIKLKNCTLASIREALHPGRLAAKYKAAAPFLWALLLIFTTSPNEYRRWRRENRVRKTAPEAGDGVKESDDEADGEWDAEVEDGDEDESSEFMGETGAEWKGKGFTRDPIFAIVLAISAMAFVRNGATNLFPFLFGLFLEINGTSSRVLSTLSSAGASVSISTVERLKKVLSDDARAFAVTLMQDTNLFYLIFDNINLYLRKSQQRLFNRNTMIHATNAAAISIPNADPRAFDLKAKLALRGKRAAATGKDILPTPEDDAAMKASFEGLVMQFILSYCPGAKSWKERKAMEDMAKQRMTSERPLPPQKTDARPLGVYDVDEGSKKGILEMLSELQKTSGVEEEQWAETPRIIQGDWLTAQNVRAARKDRVDDVNSMERVEYVEEVSALWHYALNATHMIIRVHLGHAMLDPGCLAKHKGLLNRNWDAAKPNYADAKALIRHSLVARILYGVLVKNGLVRWSDLSQWKPTPTELADFAREFVAEYTSTRIAKEAKAQNDDYRAHSIYFTRDALTFCEFERAVSEADAGPVLRVLKYWALAFRGAGLHNYARECVEVLLRWKYELSDPMRTNLEQSWFVNRWGLPGRWIPADLYLEQNNFWVKRVFIAKGSGVTVHYIREKGSACVEAFREVGHMFARAFGHPDRSRRSKEVDPSHDLRLLVDHMMHSKLHVLTRDRPVYVPAKPTKKASTSQPLPQISAVVDVLATGVEVWNSGKFEEFLRATTYDPAVNGYPVEEPSTTTARTQDVFQTGTAFDHTETNPLEIDGFDDLDDGDDYSQRVDGLGTLGGGGRD